jgi:hypothetical protein
MLAGMLTGVMPTIPTPASGAVRQHLMEDDPPRGRSAARTRVAPPSLKARDFTASDKALIRKVHGYMAPLQLLGILNERLQCDLGAGAALYTIDQLKGEIASVTTAVPASGNDWGALRKLLSKARRDGVLQLVNEQVINDFALVYSLDQKQVMSLKDIVLGGSEA